ncbi:MAG: hypothetical protein ABJG68_08480 [Crocinitomicaceae bacterium]
MKILVSLLILTSSLTAVAQKQVKVPILKSKLVSQVWRSDYNLFSDEKRLEYHIFSREEDEYFPWGNSVEFTDSTFSTSYSASCGNDCFISVLGSYKFIASNRIEVFVETITRNGMCMDKSESPKKKFGTYEIIEEENRHLIKKVTP